MEKPKLKQLIVRWPAFNVRSDGSFTYSTDARLPTPDLDAPAPPHRIAAGARFGSRAYRSASRCYNASSVLRRRYTDALTSTPERIGRGRLDSRFRGVE